MNKVFKFSQYIFTLVIVLFSAYSAAQVTGLSASVDRNSILADESFRLTIIATGNGDRDAADFSVLNNNFRVSVPSFSQSTQIINGSMSRTVSWAVNLYPKQAGRFTIPSFTIDGQSTKPFTITVLPLNAANSSQAREFYVTAEVNKNSIYLQQQLLYTVKIHLSRDIQRGQLSLPELEGAVIEQIGEDSDYQEIIDGVRYRIIERNYAVIPQSSGAYTIKGPIFEADILTDSRRSFANFGRTKSIARRAPDLALDVKPMPDNYGYTWLPSERVEVNEEWQSNSDSLVVGDPVTRTITLTALGLTKEQLPTIDQPYHPSFKVYPEQPSLTTVERNQRLIAQGTFNAAIIPEQAGSFVLPEVSIPWFNVNTGQTEFAVVPARTIEVLAKPLSTQTPSSSENLPRAKNEEAIIAQPLATIDNKQLNTLHYVLIATNALTIIAFFVFWLMNRHRKTAPKPQPNNRVVFTEQQAYQQLQNSLKQGNNNEFVELLEKWLKLSLKNNYHSVSSSLAQYPNTGMLGHYNKLLANQYSDSQQNIDFNQLSQDLDSLRKTIVHDDKVKPLTQLYPSA